MAKCLAQDGFPLTESGDFALGECDTGFPTGQMMRNCSDGQWGPNERNLCVSAGVYYPAVFIIGVTFASKMFLIFKFFPLMRKYLRTHQKNSKGKMKKKIPVSVSALAFIIVSCLATSVHQIAMFLWTQELIGYESLLGMDSTANCIGEFALIMAFLNIFLFWMEILSKEKAIAKRVNLSDKGVVFLKRASLCLTVLFSGVVLATLSGIQIVRMYLILIMVPIILASKWGLVLTIASWGKKLAQTLGATETKQSNEFLKTLVKCTQTLLKAACMVVPQVVAMIYIVIQKRKQVFYTDPRLSDPRITENGLPPIAYQVVFVQCVFGGSAHFGMMYGMGSFFGKARKETGTQKRELMKNNDTEMSEGEERIRGNDESSSSGTALP